MNTIAPSPAPPDRASAVTRTLLDRALLEATVALLKAREQVAEALQADIDLANSRERLQSCVAGVLREAHDLASRIHVALHER